VQCWQLTFEEKETVGIGGHIVPLIFFLPFSNLNLRTVWVGWSEIRNFNQISFLVWVKLNDMIFTAINGLATPIPA